MIRTILAVLFMPVLTWLGGGWDFDTIERSYGLAYVVFCSICFGCLAWTSSSS